MKEYILEHIKRNIGFYILLSTLLIFSALVFPLLSGMTEGFSIRSFFLISFLLLYIVDRQFINTEKMDIIFLSLGIKREELILKKYLEVFISYIIIIIGMLLMMKCQEIRFGGFKYRGEEYFIFKNPILLFLSISLPLIIVSLIIPFNILFKNGGRNIVNIIVMIFVFNMIYNLILDINPDQDFVFSTDTRITDFISNYIDLGIIIFIFALVLFYISFKISSYIYTNKDIT